MQMINEHNVKVSPMSNIWQGILLVILYNTIDSEFNMAAIHLLAETFTMSNFSSLSLLVFLSIKHLIPNYWTGGGVFPIFSVNIRRVVQAYWDCCLYLGAHAKETHIILGLF